jgi:outer membrane protein
MKLASKWLGIALVALALPVLAQDGLKLGYVNTERILREAAPAKASQQRLEQEFSKRDKELQEMTARLKTLGERLDREGTVLSEGDRQRRQREFSDLEKDLQRKQREFREDLNQRRNEELASVIEKANRAIRQIADQEKYDFVFQDVVFASPRVDLTDKVLKALATTK